MPNVRIAMGLRRLKPIKTRDSFFTTVEREQLIRLCLNGSGFLLLLGAVLLGISRFS